MSLLTWQRKSEKREALKKELNEDLSLIAQHAERWWKLSMSENRKK